MEATAKHDFQATAEDELSFKKGSILKVKLVVRSGLPYGNVAILPRDVYIYWGALGRFLTAGQGSEDSGNEIGSRVKRYEIKIHFICKKLSLQFKNIFMRMISRNQRLVLTQRQKVTQK